ncbi:MAG: PD-(D/E)XK nuclease family protein [Alicyclobacillus sp.]|nr:PD-(D/E)XK nuclease family protein [Alicyclobacillus sp.]
MLGILIGQWLAFGAHPSPADLYSAGHAAWQRHDYGQALRLWSHGTALQQPERTPAGRPTGWLLQRLEQVSESAAVYAPQALWLVEQIQAHAAACGLQVEVRTLPDTERPALVRAVEAAVFAGPLPPPPPAEPPVTLATAQNIRAEAEGVARAIARHVRELGWRYRDVAVLVPSLADYAGPLRDSFERHGLPVCLEDFPLLSSHPLAKFLLAAMVSAEDQASTAAMASLLKTSFCQLAEADADWLELYLRRYEVAGIDTWTQAAAWTFAQEEADPAYLADAVAADARADGLRRQVAAVLASFWAAVAAAELTPRALGESLWALLQAAAVKQRVAGWMLAATEAQRPAEATLHEQAWQRILALLDDLTETWPEALLRRSFLFELVQDDLTHQPLVTIPAGVDEVLVTEVSRARGLRVRGLWVMGAADGQLPPRVHTDGLLHDEERLLFARLFGQPLGLTGEDVQLCQRETVYLALTRASERLCVSYPLVAADGRATQPARAWERLRSHLPPGWFSSEGWRDHPGDLQPGAWSPPAALSALVHSVAATRAGAPLPATALAVFDWFAHQPAAHAALRQALAGIGQRAKARPLSAAVAQRLFGDPLHVHVHQLESFAACPFQHFARYGLRASEEVLPKADRAARGTLLHAAVQAFVQTQAADVAAWRQLTDEAAAAAARQVYTQLLHDPRTAFWRRRRSRWQQAQADLAVVEKVAVALTRQVRWGRYEPLATEVAFGSGHSAWPPLVRRLADGGTLQLRGRIDRVDVVRDGGQAVFRVIDYKSSLALKWDQSKLEHGLQLQLPLYAVALWATAERWLQQPAEPAGIFYIPTGRSLARVLIPEAATAARARALRQLRARGALAAVQAWVGWLDERLLAGGETELFARVFNQNGQWSQRSPALPPEVWRGMLRRALQHAEAIGQAIRRGDNRIAPYQLGQETACQHCRLQAVCHLERRWDRSPLRRLQRLDGAELAAAWHALGTDWAGPQADGTPMTAPLREDGAAAAADGPARGGHHDGRDVV